MRPTKPKGLRPRRYVLRRGPFVVGIVAAGLIAVGVLATVGSTADRWGFGTAGRDKGAAAAAYDEANRQQIANAPKAQKGDPQSERPAPGGPVAWDQGIYETSEAPIPSGVFETITTMWGQTIGQNHFSVYAGGSADDPLQGLLVVQTYSLRGVHMNDEDYPTPVRAGSVRIISAEGHRLSLKSDSGSLFVFDFDTRRYL